MVHFHKSKEFKDVFKKIQRFDSNDGHAMYDYTSDGYISINNALRSGTLSQNIKKRVDAIIKAMSKSSRGVKVFKGVVYRGTELPANVKDALQPGSTYSDPAFLSTSSRPDGAFKGFDDMILFQIESKSGVNIARQSHKKGEDEILFRPNTLFRIKSRQDEKVSEIYGRKLTFIGMEEIH